MEDVDDIEGDLNIGIRLDGYGLPRDHPGNHHHQHEKQGGAITGYRGIDQRIHVAATVFWPSSVGTLSSAELAASLGVVGSIAAIKVTGRARCGHIWAAFKDSLHRFPGNNHLLAHCDDSCNVGQAGYPGPRA